MTQKERACHFNELFVTNTGDIFPCCQVGRNPKLKIGHLNDKNLPNLLESFEGECSCGNYKLRRGLPEDDKSYNLLNIEFSLACQGKCAMCCVDAPSWKGTYKYYEKLRKLVDFVKPKLMWIQGGEVLIQKKSIEWLTQIKKKYPEIRIILISNGNVNLDMIEVVKELFDTVSFSLVGFEHGTYKKITGMDLEKTVKFAEALTRTKKVKIVLKYLTTPLNLHEADLFLEWAIKLAPAAINFMDAHVKGYIKMNTPDQYWEKIFSRTGQEIKSILKTNKDKIIKEKININFQNACLELFKFNLDFDEIMKENGLTGIIKRQFSKKDIDTQKTVSLR